MSTSIRIDILNPKAIKLLENLAELELISIGDDSKKGFEGILKKLRAKSEEALSLDEITREVESVRAKRYGK